MLEILAIGFVVLAVVFVLLALFSVFVAYVTQASYIDPLDDNWKDDERE